jgi:glycosyltransferase involved in cell wall biosynthesis
MQMIAGETEAGIVVDPADPNQIADAIQRLVQDPVLAHRLGENGMRAVAERFNWDKQWPKLRDLYLEILTSEVKCPA